MSETGDERKDGKADWEKELEEFLTPTKVEWEEELKEYSELPAEELPAEELPAEKFPENPDVFDHHKEPANLGRTALADLWKQLTPYTTLEFMSDAVAALKRKVLDEDEKRLAYSLSTALLEIALDPPEETSEEEEYERARARAKSIRGPSLI